MESDHGDMSSAILSESEHNDYDIGHSDVIDREPTKASGSPPDNGKDKEHHNLENSSPTVTNFSISEILKPTFGLKCKTTQANHSVGSEQTRVIRNMFDVAVKREVNRSQDLEHAYSQNRSVLFNFGCLEDKDIQKHYVVEKTSVSAKTEITKTEGIQAPGTTEQTKRQSMKSLQLNADSGPKYENVSDTSNKSPISIEKSSGTAIDKSAETASNSLTSSISSDRSPRLPSLWPAWVYCTRYSDRPSSGPRSRKVTRREKRADAKRPRTAFTNEQLLRLKSEFEASRYLTEQRRRELSRSLDLSEAQIKIWYQNKRAKMKKSTGASMSSLAVHLMAQGLYNHKAYISETRGDC